MDAAQGPQGIRHPCRIRPGLDLQGFRHGAARLAHGHDAIVPGSHVPDFETAVGTGAGGCQDTIDMQVHFLERARGSQLVAEGRVVRAGNAIAIAQVDVKDDAGRSVAMGTATFRLGKPGSQRYRNED